MGGGALGGEAGRLRSRNHSKVSRCQQEGSGPEVTVGIRLQGGSRLVWVTERLGFHQARACAPLSGAVGSQPLRAPGPWAGRVPVGAELWPPRGGPRAEGVTREV